MKLEHAEKLLVTNLIKNSKRKNKLELNKVDRLERLAGDASTRRYYRVFDGQKTYVACLDDPFKSKNKNDFLVMQNVLKENNVSVPIVYDSSPENGYILEQDLGNCTLLLKLADSNSNIVELNLYQIVLEDLIKIHNIDISEYSDSIFTQRSFDYDKLYSEFEFAYKFLFKKFLAVNLSNQDEHLLFRLFDDISSHLSKGIKVVSHRDFHSRNIMIKDNHHYVIDFQDAMLGLPQYDLVSLLEDCYYQISPTNKSKLIKYYWDLSKDTFNHGQQYEAFEYDYNIMAIQRTFKALGSFAYIYYLRNDIRYLKYIGFGFEKLRSFLAQFEKYSEAKKIISKSYYEA